MPPDRPQDRAARLKQARQTSTESGGRRASRAELWWEDADVRYKRDSRLSHSSAESGPFPSRDTGGSQSDPTLSFPLAALGTDPWALRP